MGLEHYLYLVKATSLSRHPDPTMVDGFPLEHQRLLVQSWWKHHWVHQWFCNVHGAANECEEIDVQPEELATLADKLEAWADDPEALPPVNDRLRGPFFGAHPKDPEYEDERNFHRAKAKDQAKTIRKAVEWLNVPLDPTGREYRYATYRASW